MPPRSPDDDLRVTRRLFLKHSALATASGAAMYSIALKTDAAAAQPLQPARIRGEDDLDNLYAYHNPE